jgi:hypothetical protein
LHIALFIIKSVKTVSRQYLNSQKLHFNLKQYKLELNPYTLLKVKAPGGKDPKKHYNQSQKPLIWAYIFNSAACPVLINKTTKEIRA